MNKRGPNCQPRSSLPRAPCSLTSWVSTYYTPRPYFDLLSRGEAIRDKPAQYISMGARVSVRIVPNMEAYRASKL